MRQLSEIYLLILLIFDFKDYSKMFLNFIKKLKKKEIKKKEELSNLYFYFIIFICTEFVSNTQEEIVSLCKSYLKKKKIYLEYKSLENQSLCYE